MPAHHTFESLPAEPSIPLTLKFIPTLAQRFFAMVSSLLLHHPPLTSPAVLKLRRKEQLPLNVEGLWQLETGFIRLITWDEDGVVNTLGIWGPGEQIVPALLTTDPAQLDCLSPVQACFHCITGDYPLACVIARMQKLEEFLQIYQIRCTETRLWVAFQWLAQRFGRSTTQGWLLPLRLTHQELAELIGSTRVTVTRLLQHLQQQGYLKRYGNQWLITAQEPNKLGRVPGPVGFLAAGWD